MKLYKFRSFENIEYTMDVILNERLYCAHIESLNDPFEGLFSTKQNCSTLMIGNDTMGLDGGLCLGDGGGGLIIGGAGIFMGGGDKIVYKSIDELLPELKDKVRICSLSESMADVRMWSLYASGHTGCAIEIDLELDANNIVEVGYGKGIQEFKKQLAKDKKAIDFLSFKTNHWEYEKEYRIVSEQEFFPITGKITGIYLGMRVKDIHKNLIVRSTPKDVPIYVTKIQERTIQIIPKNKIN